MYGRASFRSQNSSNQDGYLTERDAEELYVDSDEDNKSVQSNSDAFFDKRTYEELKDDKTIVKIAAMNDKYKLVERPKFLMNFDTREWEARYAATMFRKHYN